jgi:hypothetical protein
VLVTIFQAVVVAQQVMVKVVLAVTAEKVAAVAVQAILLVWGILETH